MVKREKIANGIIREYLWSRWWERGLTVIFVLAMAGFISGQAYTYAYRDKIYSGVFIGAWPVGGLTRPEAEQTLQAALDAVRTQGLTFGWRDRTVTVPAVATAAADPDLAYEVIGYDTARTLDKAFGFGRQGSALGQWFGRLQSLLGRKTIQPTFTWRADSVLSTLKANLAIYEQPGHNALLSIQGGTITIEPERSGVSFDYRSGLRSAEAQLQSLIFEPIVLEMKRDVPTITAAAASELLPRVSAFTAGGDIIIRWQDQTWNFTRLQVSSALEIRPDALDVTRPALGLSAEKLADLLSAAQAVIDIEPQEPKFRLEGSKVVEFKPSIVGRTLDLEATARVWEQALLSENKTELEPVVRLAETKQKTEDLNGLGIKELLGVGQSNFSGSPKNRRHNIAVGAAAVNGTLIAPGREFSLLKTLGKVDAKAGYLPELVIKGNKTVPEYGGGLCQIGTTVFRGTLAAGLPITERQNHSYQVPYYANAKGLPGTDATIYDPKPDYRFKNDTANYVLITTRIEGDDLFFEYWSTKDGRQVAQSDVRVWDRVSPPPVKLVETLDLKPGEKKCTEKPHAGIKAAFDYKVTYADGQVANTTFNSQYRPWQEVCLIGVEKLSTDTASSTPEMIAPEDASAAIIN